MILPTKHLRSELSLIYVGGIIQNLIASTSLTVDQLWHSVKKEYKAHNRDSEITYDWFVLALSMLYTIGSATLKDSRIAGGTDD